MGLVGKYIQSGLGAYSRIAPTERGGYRLARLARRFIDPKDWNIERTTPEGLRLNLDLATYPDICMAFGLYELDTVRLLRQLMRHSIWFVDCGANIGYFALLAGKWMPHSARIDAFEPDPINRARFFAHLQRNGPTDRVRIHEEALGRGPGMIELYHPTESGKNHGMASMYSAIAGDSQKFNVKVVALHDALDGVPDLIKIDVEGAEMAVIEGMSRMLTAVRPPRLIIEHNPESCAAAGHKPSDLMRLIQRIQPKYCVSYIDWRLKPIENPDKLDRIRRQTNLLFEV